MDKWICENIYQSEEPTENIVRAKSEKVGKQIDYNTFNILANTMEIVCSLMQTKIVSIQVS